MGVYLTARQMVYSAHNYKARVCVRCLILGSRFPASLHIFAGSLFFHTKYYHRWRSSLELVSAIRDPEHSPSGNLLNFLTRILTTLYFRILEHFKNNSVILFRTLGFWIFDRSFWYYLLYWENTVKTAPHQQDWSSEQAMSSVLQIKGKRHKEM